MIQKHKFSYAGIDGRTAYHQAGQATSIYLGNKLKKLPDVYFKIHVGSAGDDAAESKIIGGVNDENHPVFIEGGRLVDNLALLLADTSQSFSHQQREQYRQAFEADISNLLVGALTEAKYVAKLENRIFNAHSLNIDVLTEFSDSGDLEIISQYRQLYKQDSEKKLIALLKAAINFVNNPWFWRAIKDLAHSIQSHIMSSISCEEVSAIVKPHVPSLALRRNWSNTGLLLQSSFAVTYN